LKSKLQFSDILVYNLGISYDTTRKVLKRLESELEPRNPSLVIFAIGMNDSIYVGSRKENLILTEEYKSNLEEIIDHIRKISSIKDVLFIGLTNIEQSKVDPMPWSKGESCKLEMVKEYGNILKEFCFRKNINYLDVFDILGKKDLYDGMHPNTRGHKKLFKRIYPEVDRILKEISD